MSYQVPIQRYYTSPSTSTMPQILKSHFSMDPIESHYFLETKVL